MCSMPRRVSRTTHLVKHSVSKTQQLPEEVEPAVQEGKEAQQKEHYTYDTKKNREGLRGTLSFWALLPAFS